VNVETGKTEGKEEELCKCEVDDLIMASKRVAQKLMGVNVSNIASFAESGGPLDG